MQRANCHKNRGITLIALIITIIVMLILIAVTINVALNGGLFKNAKDSAKKQEEQTIYEQIVGIAVWTNDGEINVKETVDAIEESGAFNIKSKNPSTITDSTTEVTLTIAGKRGDYSYKITTKEITIENGNGTGGGGVSKEQALVTLQELIDVNPTVSSSDNTARIYLIANTEIEVGFNIPNETIEFKALDFRNNYAEAYFVVVYKGYWYDISVNASESSATLGKVTESQYVADSNDIFNLAVLDANQKTVKITSLTTHAKNDLTTIVIPKTITNANGGEIYTVTEIGDSAFYNAGKNITFAEDSEVVSIETHAFKSAFNKSNMPKDFRLPSKLQYVGEEVMSGYTEGMDGTLYIPKTVTDMGKLAFWETNFSTIIFEEGSQIDHLGNQWFAPVHNLTDIYIPGTINTIDVTAIEKGNNNGGFAGNSELTIHFDGTSTKFSGMWYFISDRDVGLTVICTDGTFTYNSNGEFVPKTV